MNINQKTIRSTHKLIILPAMLASLLLTQSFANAQGCSCSRDSDDDPWVCVPKGCGGEQGQDDNPYNIQRKSNLYNNKLTNPKINQQRHSFPGDQFDKKNFPGDQLDKKNFPGDQLDKKNFPGDQLDKKN